MTASTRLKTEAEPDASRREPNARRTTDDRAARRSTPGVIERELRIAAAPETVFDLLDRPGPDRAWMGRTATIDPRPGGAFRIDYNGSDIASGEILEIDRPRRLVLSWGWEAPGDATPPGASRVEVSLEPDGDGTILRLRHSGLATDAARGPRRGLGPVPARSRGGRRPGLRSIGLSPAAVAARRRSSARSRRVRRHRSDAPAAGRSRRQGRRRPPPADRNPAPGRTACARGDPGRRCGREPPSASRSTDRNNGRRSYGFARRALEADARDRPGRREGRDGAGRAAACVGDTVEAVELDPPIGGGDLTGEGRRPSQMSSASTQRWASGMASPSVSRSRQAGTRSSSQISISSRSPRAAAGSGAANPIRGRASPSSAMTSGRPGSGQGPPPGVERRAADLIGGDRVAREGDSPALTRLGARRGRWRRPVGVRSGAAIHVC